MDSVLACIFTRGCLLPFPGLSQFRGASCESAAAIADTGGHQRLWLSEVVAAVHASDGGRLDGSCLEPQRDIVLPGAAVGTAADGLNNSAS